jgi:glycosyltransferase involved in cell wall biosynthesis
MNKEFEKLRESWLDFNQFKERYQKVPVEEYPNNVLKAVPNSEISVRIITYQHAPYIREAIESVLMQKVDVPWEIIIGDDESTDGTREICIEYAKKYPDLIRLFLHKRENNIKILNNPSHIFQWSYNSYNLRGKFVAACSGDDYWTDEQKLAKQYKFMVNNPSFSYTYHDFVRFYVDSNKKVLSKNKHRIQTVMAINIFDKMPVQLASIIQEDTFWKFFWSLIGKQKNLDDIKPTVVRFFPKQMYSSLDREEIYKHQINLWENIKNISKGSNKILSKANDKLYRTIFNFQISKKKKIFSFLYLVFNYRLIKQLFLHFFVTIKKKF